MQEAFGYVLFAVVIGAAIVALITFAGTGRLYDQIGRGGLFEDDDAPKPAPGSSAGRAEQEAEIRQMLQARNARRLRKGEEPLDIDDELARLLAPASDPGLEAEIRQLVIARNGRRTRRGEEPLDVEEEVARQLRELG